MSFTLANHIQRFIINLFKLKKKKIIAIGDNLNTDIKGANNMNYDSLIITNGIHKNEFEKEGVEKILKKYNVVSTYSQSNLKW